VASSTGEPGPLRAVRKAFGRSATLGKHNPHPMDATTQQFGVPEGALKCALGNQAGGAPPHHHPHPCTTQALNRPPTHTHAHSGGERINIITKFELPFHGLRQKFDIPGGWGIWVAQWC